MQSQPTSEIEKAIDLLIALKSARPASFDEAMAKISSAPTAGDGAEAAHASSLVLGLLKGPFGIDSSGMLLELAAKLPRMADEALGLCSKGSPAPASLASRILRMHKLGSPWARFLLRSMRDGLLPQDRECVFELASRLQMAVAEGEGSFDWLGSPDEFYEALGAFFELDCDWRSLSAQTGLDFLPWILQYWLHDGSSASFQSAVKASCRLMERGAISGLSPSSWLEFARPPHEEHARASIEAMELCLLLSLPLLLKNTAGPCLMFCKSAYPTPWMAEALRAVARIDPRGPLELDFDGLSCAYFVNSRIPDHDSDEWQLPLVACFEALVDAGADPRSIAPQLELSSLARHPTIAAAVEAAQIMEQASQGRDSRRKTL